MLHDPFDVPLLFPDADFRFYGRPLADGLRASTASRCASCAIIEYLNPSDERIYTGFETGVATFGHIFHQVWAYQSFDDYVIEEPVPWAHGLSHEDVVVKSGKWAGQYEVKTHSENKPKAPSQENYRQTEFRMRLRELAGMPVYGPTRIVTISTAGREKGIARGPWNVTLTDQARSEIDATLVSIDELMQKAATLDLHGDELRELSKGCTTCFPKPRIESTPKADDLMQAYGRIKTERDAADAERRDALEAKKHFDAELQEIKTKLDSLIPAGVVVEGITHNATRTKTGTLKITPRNDAA